MKLITINALLLVAFVLTACGGSSEKFAGFTVVGMNKETAKFYIDTNSVKRSNKGSVSFNLVRVLPNGYAIQTAETDCKTSFSSFEGVKYSDDGTSEEKFIAETLTLPNKDNSDINTLVKMACGKSEENRIIIGAFDDSKALEILYGTYQPTTQTALWAVIDPPKTLEGYENFLGKSGTVKILDSKDFIEQGKVKHIVLTSTSVSDSPQILLNASVFIKIGDKWHIETEYPYLKVDSDSEPYIFHWERVGKEHYGVIEANIYKIPKNYNDSKGYIVLYELNAKGLNNLLVYSENNVLEYSKFIDNNENVEDVNITFPESNKTYWDATITISKDKGQAQEVYRLQKGNEVPLSKNALKELFGVRDPSGKVKTAKNELTSVWFEQSFNDGKDNTHVVFTKTQSLDNIGNIESCHACTVAIGAITYKFIDSQWQIVSKQPKFEDSIGYWGDAPEIKQAEILQLSPNNLVLMISESDMHHGITDEWMDLFSYYKNNWRNLGSIYTGNTDCMHQNEKGDDCRSSFKGKISIVNDKKSEYPDLLVTKTGTEEDTKGNIVPAKNAIYFFNGKEYEEKQQIKAVSPAMESRPKASTQQTTSSADTPQMKAD